MLEISTEMFEIRLKFVRLMSTEIYEILTIFEIQFGFEQNIRYLGENLWHVYQNVHSISTKMFEILTTTFKISIKMFEISTKTVWKFDLNHSDFFQNLEILTKTIVKPKIVDSKTLRSKTLEILTKILQILTKSNQIVTKI